MRDTGTRVLGVAPLFSGAALVTHISTGMSLGLALLLGVGLMAAAVAAIWRRSTLAARTRLRRRAWIGLLAGGVATVAYDLARFVLSRWDPSPYNPFETLRAFGAAFAGPGAGDTAIYAAGSAFHLANGICFAIAFCLLFGPRGAVAGIAWALGLELFQLTLYPGWLDIRFYGEFVQISVFSHVVYGALLGYGCRHGLSAGG